VVWYGVVPLLPPVSARGFAEGGGVMQRLAGQTDSEISACSEMGQSETELTESRRLRLRL
jgi:hypothetical protein